MPARWYGSLELLLRRACANGKSSAAQEMALVLWRADLDNPAKSRFPISPVLQKTGVLLKFGRAEADRFRRVRSYLDMMAFRLGSDGQARQWSARL
jgi:hypothetical protein